MYFFLPDFLQQEDNAMDNNLSAKSRERYLITYENFLQWKKANDASPLSENMMMAYFTELATNYKPSTMWALYSMLKCTIKIKHGVDIARFSKLTEFLRNRNKGFQPKKSKVLSIDDIQKFIDKAPNYKYLATKVALIFGIMGACRRQELTELTTDNIEQQGEILVVKIPSAKSQFPRTFVIEGEFFKLVKQYEALRTPKLNSNRFFQNYQNGRCLCQYIGINKFGAMPKQIAAFLGLPNPELYTGHSFRRTSAKLLANMGTNLETLKRLGGWMNTDSGRLAEDPIQCENVEESINLNEMYEPCPSTSNVLDVKIEPFHLDLDSLEESD